MGGGDVSSPRGVEVDGTAGGPKLKLANANWQVCRSLNSLRTQNYPSAFVVNNQFGI